MNRICAAAFALTQVFGIATIAEVAQAQSAVAALEQGFKTPPDSVKPRTWWHWTSGNVTKEGITKDLEWMKRVGIGGFQLADVASGGGQTVDKKLLFGSTDWLDAVRHAAAEADRLGLEMAIFSSAGWSETGGPWVKPEQAMKKFVWSQTTVEGPTTFNEKLKQPPSNIGAIRNLGSGGARGGAPDGAFYGDSAVIAFRTPADEKTLADLHPKITTSGGEIDGKALLDDDLNSSVAIRASQSGPAWVQFELAEPFTARAVTIASRDRGGIPFGRLAASDDGKEFRTLVELPGTQQYRGGMERTYSFTVTTAKFFRLELTAAPLDPAATINQTRTQSAQQYVLNELIIHSAARVHHWEEKAGFNFVYQYESVPTPTAPSSSAIFSTDVVDLTSKMAKDGTLNWDVPAGKWTILRMGYSLTGARNRPAPPTGSGLEVDKLSRKHVEAYYHGYFDPLAAALGPLFGKSLRYVMMDSWEAGMQNWTDDMLAEFRRRRGYDPTPYLPALTGHVIGDAEVSDRFLWDFRRTLADLFAENHYGTMADLLHQHGIGIYGEAAGVSMEVLEDTLLNKSKVDIPMGEFWVRALHPPLEYYADVRGAASASHAYGKTLVATESFTGGGYEAPYTLKKVGDYWFAQGVNRIVFHTSAHQPLDTKPGNTMVGTHINRNITWAEQAAPFMAYLARCSYMLQQGLYVADVAYLLPEGAPSSQPFWGPGLRPACPDGYDYDCLNTDVLLSRVSVADDGRLVLPDGMSYRVLVLPEIDRMTPRVLRKIRDLAAGGATIVGQKPAKSPSLEGYPAADNEVRELAAGLWGDLDGVTRNRQYYGKGKVIWGLPLADVLASLPVPKDFEYSKSLDADVVWTHRRTSDTDIYFVANHTDQPQNTTARFRVAGKEAEIWRPDTGTIEPAEFFVADGRTTVPLNLAERESVFVVFRKQSSAPSRTLPLVTDKTLASIDASWDVAFAPNLGAPERIQLAKLEPWTANADQGVKYFSGTATYSTTMQVPELTRGTRIWFDLGNVKDVADVSLNGRKVGTVWKPPYRIDITDVLKPGENRLEVAITNEWTNRIAGDRVAPADKKVLSGGGGGIGAGGFGGGRGGAAPLPESGLLGPVTIVAQSNPRVVPTVAAAPQAGARRGPISSSPREQQPFTNGDFNAANPKLPSLIITGDSTAARNSDADHRGWGAVLVDYFDTSKVNVVNRAIAGRSFRTYYGEGAWQRVADAIKPGDFVVIEFGHNDGGGAANPLGRGDVPGTGDETQEVTRRDGTKETVHTYGWYERKFIQDVRAKGGTPIVSSTTVRNIWKDGKVERGMGRMLEWAKQVADEEKVALVDHSNITADVYEKMGADAVAKYFPADHTHTSTDGAVTNAETFIAGLKALPNMPLVDWLNEKGKAIEAYKPMAHD